MGYILLDASSNPMKDKVFGNCQDEFSRIKSCQTNKIAFHKEMTGLQNEGRGGDNFLINFSKVFNTVSHSICVVRM